MTHVSFLLFLASDAAKSRVSYRHFDGPSFRDSLAPVASTTQLRKPRILDAVQVVKFEVFKSKIRGLHSCVALLGLKISRKDGPSECLSETMDFAASEAKKNRKLT